MLKVPQVLLKKTSATLFRSCEIANDFHAMLAHSKLHFFFHQPTSGAA